MIKKVKRCMCQNKRILAWIMSVVLFFGILPIYEIDADDKLVSGYYTYEILDNGTARIVEYNGAATIVNVPETLKGYTVTEIGESAFASSSIKQVTLPNSTETIGNKAFNGCTKLTEITLQDGLLTIGDEAFSGCTSLTTIILPDSLLRIGAEAFRSCTNLTAITLPNNLNSIGERAIVYCTNVSTIHIPASVSNIEYGAFSYSRLESITVDEDNKQYKSVDGILFNKDGSELHTYPRTKSGNLYEVPDHVKYIADYAFSGVSRLECLELQTGLLSIGKEAFDATNFPSILIPKTVASIGTRAFGNTQLKEIVVDEENEYYSSHSGVLYNKEMTELICYPGSKQATEYAIPDGVTHIGEYAFDPGKSLLKVSCLTIPTSVRYFERNAFYYDSPSEIYYLGSETDWNKISFEEDWISEYLLEDITITFALSSNPTATPTIKPTATVKPTASPTVKPTATPTVKPTATPTVKPTATPAIKPTATSTVKPTATPTVKPTATPTVKPTATPTPKPTINPGPTTDPSLFTYEVTSDTTAKITGYTGAKVDIVLPSVIDGYTITAIDEWAFAEQKSLKSVVISDYVESLGYSCFWECPNLESVIISNSVKSIGETAFYKCTSLKSIEIPDSVTTLGNNVFKKCTALESVVLSDNLTDIPDAAFYECEKLTYVDFPAFLEIIDINAFNGCLSLKSIELPNKLTTIKQSAFSDCDSLREVKFPDSLLSVELHAFAYCDLLREVYISSSVNSINEAYAFHDCQSLVSIIVDDNNKVYASYEGILYNKEFSELHYVPIGVSAFTIIESAVTMGEYSMNNEYCERSLDYIIYLGDHLSIVDNMYLEEDKILYVKAEYVDAFQEKVDREWPYFIVKAYDESLFPEISLGDINADASINASDALLVLKCAASMIEFSDDELSAADVTRDGKVNASDALKILKYAAGIINEI